MLATGRPRLATWQLFAIAVAIWSTTWHAILYQLEHTTPELGVALRFALAGAIALAIAALRGERLRLSGSEAGRVALQGVFMYSLSYLAVYHAERHVPSGLVAVGYSVSPLINGVAAWCLWRSALGLRFVAGGILCVAGVGLIFAPEFAAIGASASGATLRGVLFTVAAVLLAAVGSLLSSRNVLHRLPFWSTIGWGMLASALVSGAVGAALEAAAGRPSASSWALPSPMAAPAWWISLLYLAVAGSVVAFACYLGLQQRVGPGAASTVGVMTPVLALLVSAAFEGFRPVALTWLGVALAVAGNVLILRPRSALEGPAAAAR